MGTKSPLHSIIGCHKAVSTVNRRYGLKLPLNGFLLLYAIKTYNDNDIVCGGIHAMAFFKLNGRYHSANELQVRFTSLKVAGLITLREGSRRGYLLDFHVASLGLIVFAEFDRLLLSYSVKGLP